MSYSWIDEYKRTWEEDEPLDFLEQVAAPTPQSNLRPLLKHTLLVLDYSKAMLKGDMGPPSHKVLSYCMKGFQESYYTYNPLSLLRMRLFQVGQKLFR